MSSPADKLLRNEYLLRLNRTIDYIQNNYSEELNLSKLARIACFSKYHFHRIFLSLTGETINDFVRRIRLEKSRERLKYDLGKSITEIALECGFSSSQNFAKAFRAQYGVTPSIIRDELHWDHWKETMNSLREKDKQHLQSTEEFLYDLYRNKRKLPIDRILNKQSVLDVKIKKIPDLRVAYFRSIGPYTNETTAPVWKQLVQWAKPQGLMNEENMVLGVIWSDPDVTPEKKLIYDACITIPESITVDRFVNIQNLPGGVYAVYHCEIEVNSIEEAWMSFFLNWLASSDYQPDTRPSYQIYYKHPEKQVPKRVILDLCYAIKPLIY